MKLSIGILVKDEYIELEKLLSFLKTKKENIFEIKVLVDAKDITDINENVQNVLNNYNQNITVHMHELNYDFSNHRNYLNSLLTGDYILQIDADEIPSPELISNCEKLIEESNYADLILLPRINIVDGITNEDIQKWNWNVTLKNNYINFPDYQGRLYKNSKQVYWVNKVHESIYTQYLKKIYPIPYNTNNQFKYYLYHKKSIERQRLQNDFYLNNF